MILELSDLKSYIGVDPRGTTDDDKYIQSLEWAESVLYQYRNVAARDTYNEHHDCNTLIIPNVVPIYSVTSIYLNDVLLVEDTDYFVYTTYIKIPRNTSTINKGINLTYVAGVLATDTDIKYLNHYYAAKTAILKLAAYDCQKGATYNGGKDLALYQIIDEAISQIPGVITF